MAQAQAKTPPQAQTANDAEKAPEPITVSVINAKNAASTAASIFALIEGKTFKDKNDLFQTFVGELRKVRDSNKNTRAKVPLEQLLKDAIGLPMAKLQTVKVQVGGVSMNIPTLIRISETPDSALQSHAEKFMKEHKLTVKREKKGSRGKETTYLQSTQKAA